jgi:hypothetical protein
MSGCWCLRKGVTCAFGRGRHKIPKRSLVTPPDVHRPDTNTTFLIKVRRATEWHATWSQRDARAFGRLSSRHQQSSQRRLRIPCSLKLRRASGWHTTPSWQTDADRRDAYRRLRNNIDEPRDPYDTSLAKRRQSSRRCASQDGQLSTCPSAT